MGFLLRKWPSQNEIFINWKVAISRQLRNKIDDNINKKLPAFKDLHHFLINTKKSWKQLSKIKISCIAKMNLQREDYECCCGQKNCGM